MASNTIEIVIKAKDESSGVLGGVQKALGGLGSVAGTVVKAGMIAGAAGVAAFTAGLGLSIKEAMEAQEVQSQLAAVLKSTGGAAGVTADMANDLANKYMGMTRFSDEAVLSAENMLLTFTNIGKDVFPTATETALNMSAALGQDLKSSSIQLGKALNDPVNGMTALQRVGVQFTDDQKKMIEQLVRSGDVMGAQKVILDELQKEFGGSAEAAGKTFAGQLDILRNSLLNVAEGIGMGLLPIGQQLLEKFILPALPAIQAFGEAFARALEKLSSGDLKGALLELFPPDMVAKILLIADTVGDMARRVSEWIKNTALPALRSFADWFMNDALPAVSKFIAVIWDQLGPGLTQLGKWIGDIAAVVLPLLSQAIQFVVDHWQVFAAIAGVVVVAILALTSPLTLVIAAVVALATAWANNWGGIQEKTAAVTEAIKGIIDPFLKAIQAWWAENGTAILAAVQSTWENIKTIINGVITFVQGIVQAGLALVKTIWDQHGTAIQAAAAAAWEMIKTVISSALTIIQNVIKAVASIIKGDWQGLGDALKSIWDALWKAIGAILDAAKAGLQASIGVIKTVLETAWASLKTNLQTWWEQTWTAIKTRFSTFVTDLKSAVDGLIKSITATWKTFLDGPGSLRALWAAAWEAIKEKIAAAWTAIKATVNTIITGIKAAFKIDWGAVGKAVADGIAGGISKGAGAIAAAAKKAAQAALAAAKKLLGIKSPSAEFEEIGLQVCEGFVEGIGKGLDSVHKSAVEMVERFEKGFRETEPKVMAALDENIQALIKGFMSAGTAVGKTAYEVGSVIIGKLAGVINEKKPQVVAALDTNVQAMITGFMSAGTAVGDVAYKTGSAIISRVSGALRDTQPQVVSALDKNVQDMITGFMSAGTAVGDTAYKTGERIMGKFARGVSDTGPQVEAAMDENVQAMITGFMSAGTAGESAIGQMTGQWVGALEQTAEEIREAANKIAESFYIDLPAGTFGEIGQPVDEAPIPLPAGSAGEIGQPYGSGYAPPVTTSPSDPFFGGIGAPPGNALGGPVWAGMAALAGERAFTRPELFVPSRNGYILTRQQAQEALARSISGGMPQRTTNMTLNVYTSAAAEPLLADYNTLKAWAKG